MKKLLTILGPAIIAASAASVVNINPYHNNEKLSNEIINARQEGTQNFSMVFDTGKYNDDTGKPLTQTHDETKVLTDFVNKMRNFVHKNNVVSFYKVNIESQFYQTGFSGKELQVLVMPFLLLRSLPLLKTLNF